MANQRFNADNTEGYTAAELRYLNGVFSERCLAEGVDPDGEDTEKSHIDHISERVLADYDSGLLGFSVTAAAKMNTTYTVTDNNGDVIDSGLTATEAMDLILTDDGHEWEIRPEADGEGFRLWTSTHSRNSTAYNGLTRSVVYSLATDAATAEQEIAEKVIAAGWPRKPDAVTDEAHAAMMAEIEADEASL